MKRSFRFNTTEVATQHLGETTPEVQELSDKMCRAWVDFAYTGKPAIDGLDWKPYTKEEGPTMYFNEECSMRYNHDRDLMTIMQNTF